MVNFGNIKTKAGINYMTTVEEKTLFSFLKNRRDRQAARDYVLFKICRATGLRRGEVLALNISYVIDKDKIIVDETIAEKGAVGQVYLPVGIQELVRHFLRLKRNWNESLEADSPLFISRKGGRLSLRAFNDAMDKWCALAGIPHFTPHAFRHTRSQRTKARLIAEGRQDWMLVVAAQMRHQSLNSTMIYAGPNKEDMLYAAEI